MPAVIQPFPTDPAERRAITDAMKAAAPALMADIADLRKQFPGARLTYFQADGIELGTPPTQEGWLVDEQLSRRVADEQRRKNPTPEQKEAKRVAKKTTAARKRKAKAA